MTSKVFKWWKYKRSPTTPKREMLHSNADQVDMIPDNKDNALREHKKSCEELQMQLGKQKFIFDGGKWKMFGDSIDTERSKLGNLERENKYLSDENSFLNSKITVLEEMLADQMAGKYLD